MVNTTFLQYNYCTTDYYNDSGKCHLVLYDGEETALNKRCNKYLKQDDCQDSAKINMTTQDYNLAMGFTSILIFFVFSFTLLYSATHITRKS